MRPCHRHAQIISETKTVLALMLPMPCIADCAHVVSPHNKTVTMAQLQRACNEAHMSSRSQTVVPRLSPACVGPSSTVSSNAAHPAFMVQRCKASAQQSSYACTTTRQRLSICRAAATAPAAASNANAFQDLEVSKAMAAILNYALEFARASETYEVNSWMLLLGILKHENSTAAKTLKSMGLEDLYGAWHEVLWAMNSVDALEPRAFQPEIGFADRAFHVLRGATQFAEWGGRKKVQSEDLLMALAAGAVLDGLFPDLKMNIKNVRAAVEKQAGGVYVLPDDDDIATSTKPLKEEDQFL